MTRKSVFDLDENVAAALSYVLGPISGIFVLVMERENKFVRFHALQSTLWFLLLMVLWWVITIVFGFVTWIPLVGWVFRLIRGLVFGVGGLIYFFSKLILIFKAYQNETYKIPFIGEAVYNQINK